MNKDRKLVFGILMLLVGIVAVSISYAAFTQNLNINGTANVTASSWSVHFANLTNGVRNGTAVEQTAPTIKSGQTSIGDYSVDFYTPGDSITYTFDVVNDGDYDAKIAVLTKGTPTCTGSDPTSNTNVCANLEYTLTYTTGGTPVAQNDALRKNETKNMTLVLRYKTTIGQNELPTAIVTVGNLEITLQYAQASLYDGANSEIKAITYVNRQNFGQITVGDEVAIDTEHFYVVSNDSTNTVLLTKYDLNTSLNAQVTGETDTNISRLPFSNSYYWYDNGLKSEYENASNAAGTSSYSSPYPYVYDRNSYLYTFVNEYANKIATLAGITVTGRLMTYEEAVNLSTDIRKDLNSYQYWLGSITRDKRLWRIDIYTIDIEYYNNLSGLRPVIVVSTSDIES